MRRLHVTTPLMRGVDVTRLQKWLVTKGYLRHDVTGKYDVPTGQAVYRAMFWLGYLRPTTVHQTLERPGLLIAYLSGSRKPSVAMKLLAVKRRRAHPAKKVVKKTGLTPKQRLVQTALSQLGQTESPFGSNRSKFALWYGVIGAWCAMFVTWCHITTKTGHLSFLRSVRYAYVPYIVNDATSARNGLMLAAGPATGIVVCFDWNGDGEADHVGLCVDAADAQRFAPQAFAHAIAMFGALGRGDFWAVEGNTGVGNDSNGGEVMLRKRNKSLVRAFVRVAL